MKPLPTDPLAENPRPAGVGGLGEACGHMRRPRGKARALIASSVRDFQLLFLVEFGEIYRAMPQFLLAWMILQMFTLLIRARWLSPLRHILFLCKFNYRHAITSSWRTKSVGVLSSVGHFVNNSKKSPPKRPRTVLRTLKSPPKGSRKLPKALPEMPERPSEAPDRSRSP